MPDNEFPYPSHFIAITHKLRKARDNGSLAEYDSIHDWLYENVDEEITKELEACLEEAGFKLT